MFLTWVFFSQDGMVFHPDKYMKSDYTSVPARTVRLPFRTSAGEQFAWYTPPRDGDAGAIPETLWILFNGNASLALLWTDTIKGAPDADAGYLVFDYPGYGDSEGKPTIASISEAADGAFAALAGHLNTDVETLAGRQIRLLGYSLGAAVALDFAARHTVDRIVLAAPFTTMRAMADRVVSPWLSWLLVHRFDNLKSFSMIAALPTPPQIIIAHGTPDPVVPVEMSRELKSRWPNLIELVEVPYANHTSILDNVGDYMGEDLPENLGESTDSNGDINGSDVQRSNIKSSQKQSGAGW